MKRIVHKAGNSFRLRRLFQRLQNCFSRPFILAAALVALTIPCVAQEKWNASFRTGINFPTKKLGTTVLKPGLGMDGTIGYRVMPHLFVNGGWGWNRFTADDESNNDYEETGYLIGLQYKHPIGLSKLHYVAGISATYKHIEVENSHGDVITDTGHGWGWQANAGLGIPLGKRTALIPSLRYSVLSRNLKVGNLEETPVELAHFSGGLELSWRF